jgi:hypothetical protein
MAEGKFRRKKTPSNLRRERADNSARKREQAIQSKGGIFTLLSNGER